MTIQQINLGTAPNGVGGDTLRSTAAKINANFTDAANAASKLIGTNYADMSINQNIIQNGYIWARPLVTNGSFDYNTAEIGKYYYANGALTNTNAPKAGIEFVFFTFKSWNDNTYIQIAYEYASGNIWNRVKTGVWSVWVQNMNTSNTTRDSNGFLKAASPIVKVFSDKVGLNGEAEDQNVTYVKNGIGDYTITTESGLSTDGWYLELPKDLNGNPKVAVTLSEVEGVITLKSYKRVFSMETFTFEPDLDTPLDIPTDRWIDIRLNEIPVDYTELDKEPKEPYSEV